MCCLFGLLDPKSVFSGNEKNVILSVLSTECMVRGVDATGIAYNTKGRLSVFKRPIPANRLHYAVPSSARYIMGHTRMTTQGSEKRNYNNHPFIGAVATGRFALCHNGVIYNDLSLRKSQALPQTKIETDSYIAVQLLENQNALNFGSLRDMAEKVEGSFTFTVLDSNDSLYVVRGSNPFVLYHFRKSGFYLYASTNEILMKAMIKLGIQDWARDHIPLSHGDIIKIDKHGKMKLSSFNAFNDWGFVRNVVYSGESTMTHATVSNSYIQELKSVASFYGFTPEDIDCLLIDGFTCDEIEEFMYMPCYIDSFNRKEC